MKKFIKLNAKANETDTPFFFQSKKTPSGAYEKITIGNFIEGRLDTASIVEGEYQGNKFKSFQLNLKTDGEDIILTMSHNSLTYSIVNSLVSVPLNTDVRIEVYKTKSEKNGKYYPSAKIQHLISKERISWKIPYEQQPRSVEAKDAKGNTIMNKGKKVYLSQHVEEFWENLYTSWVNGDLDIPLSAGAPGGKYDGFDDLPF